MTGKHFEIRCAADAEAYALKSPDGQSWTFPTIEEALKFAQGLAPDGDARLTVFNSHGAVTIETFV